jgi:hypothetical protein
MHLLNKELRIITAKDASQENVADNPEDLRALHIWVEAKRIDEQRNKTDTVGFPTLPWHCG